MHSTRRDLTAIRRLDLSRPIRTSLEDQLINADVSVLDYGCGHGGDVRRLQKYGVDARGWDPAYNPDTELKPRDVVNLGYVINVIEDPKERVDTLRTAWSLAERLLIVSARLSFEANELDGRPYRDGVLTSRGTFQKFYDQRELRDWIEDTLEEECIAAAPGVFYVFRDHGEQQAFLADRQHRRAGPRPRRSDVLFEQNRELFERLMDFVEDRGRLPHPQELEIAADIQSELGSIRRAFSIVKRVTGREHWKEIRKARSKDVLVLTALLKFGGRPRFSDLPFSMQRDVRAFFSSYKRACEEADSLLFSIGDEAALERAFQATTVGRLTHRGLYLHVSALPQLPPILRVYEGSAERYLGTVEGANVVKLHRAKPAVTYLSYPDFETDPHPVLTESLRLELHTFDIKMRNFREWADQPILHRKNEYLAPDHPLHDKFARLTEQEDRYGLHEDPGAVSTQDAWRQALSEQGLRLQGHRLVQD